jgi:hypothetical protein
MLHLFRLQINVQFFFGPLHRPVQDRIGYLRDSYRGSPDALQIVTEPALQTRMQTTLDKPGYDYHFHRRPKFHYSSHYVTIF